MRYKDLSIYNRFIGLSVIVYVITQCIRLLELLFCWTGYDWAQWLGLHSNLNDFAMTPWTLVTYMFCHADLSVNPLHLLFNMLWIWWFGQYFVRVHSNRQFVTFYLTAGVFAGVFFLVCYNVFPYFSLARHNSYLVGASGVVFAFIVAVAMRQPEEVVGINLLVRVVWLRMKWLAMIVLGLNLLSSDPGNVGGTVCHVGGILFGLWYGWKDRKGTDITAWMSRLADWTTSMFAGWRKPKMKATRGGRPAPVSADRKCDMDYNAARHDKESQIDAILEKISRSGYDGLSAEEKQILFDASRRKR